MPQVVSFDPDRFMIEEVDNSPTQQTSTQVIEAYSEWKDWAKDLVADNLKYAPAFRVVGGDPISPSLNLGSTFFLTNSWKLKPAEYSHQWELIGNLFADPFTNDVVIPTDGAYTVLTILARSNLVDSSVARLDLAQLQEAVFIDTVSGNDSANGSPTAPVQTETRAYEIAQEENLRAFSILGNISLSRNYTAWKFLGTISKDSAVITLNGYDVNACKFENIEVNGSGTGIISADNIRMVSISGISGTIKYSGLSGITLPGANSKTTLYKCYSEEPGLGAPIIDAGNLVTANLIVRGFSGSIDLRNVDMVSQDVTLDFESGRAIIGNTNTAGNIVIRNANSIEDTSAGVTVTIQERGEFTESDRTTLEGALTEDTYIELKSALD